VPLVTHTPHRAACGTRHRFWISLSDPRHHRYHRSSRCGRFGPPGPG